MRFRLRKSAGTKLEPDVELEIDLDYHHEQAWNRLPTSLRRQAVDRLKEIVGPEILQELYEARNDPFFHFSSGMALRNVLRSDHGQHPKPKNAPIRDSELPDLADLYQEHGSGEFRNWDDYYVQVLEAAVGKRDING